MRIEALSVITVISLLSGWKGPPDPILTEDGLRYVDEADAQFRRSFLTQHLRSKSIAVSPNNGGSTGETGSLFDRQIDSDQGDNEINP